MAAIGACGYAAPEITDYLIKIVKAKGEAELAKVKKGIPSNGKKKSAKRKR